MTSGSRSHPPTKSILALAFSAIALLLIGTAVASLVRMRANQRAVDLIVNNASESVRLVDEMGMAIKDEQLLIERHIFESEPTSWTRVERQLAQVRANYEHAARAYEPLVAFRGEKEAWARMNREVTEARTPLEAVLNLSHKNLDELARQSLALLEPRFDEINRDVATLVAINQAASKQSLEAVLDSMRYSRALVTTFTGLGILLTLVIFLWVSHFVRRNEDLLQARNRELDAFAGRVAHDLRNPLSLITMAAEVLSQRVPEQEQAVNTLRRGVLRTEKLIEDLLALSRVDRYLECASCNPATVAGQLRDELGPRLDTEGAKVHVALEESNVRCSEGLFRQLLSNLIDNALKYRREDVRLEVEILGHSAGTCYELDVSDNGMGMSTEDTRRAFEPFYRSTATSRVEGTGLGLSIVRRVVEASHGNVSIESRPGRGTKVRVALPTTQTHG
jgi:signal transduction histidine kinase